MTHAILVAGDDYIIQVTVLDGNVVKPLSGVKEVTYTVERRDVKDGKMRKIHQAKLTSNQVTIPNPADGTIVVTLPKEVTGEKDLTQLLHTMVLVDQHDHTTTLIKEYLSVSVKTQEIRQ